MFSREKKKDWPLIVGHQFDGFVGVRGLLTNQAGNCEVLCVARKNYSFLCKYILIYICFHFSSFPVLEVDCGTCEVFKAILHLPYVLVWYRRTELFGNLKMAWDKIMNTFWTKRLQIAAISFTESFTMTAMLFIQFHINMSSKLKYWAHKVNIGIKLCSSAWWLSAGASQSWLSRW